MVPNAAYREDVLIMSQSDINDTDSDSDTKKLSLYAKEYDPVTFNMLKVKAVDFANQITIGDLAVFKSITSEELLSGSWCKKNKRSLAPNVMRFTDRFNLVCLWCQREILSYDKCSKRAEVMAHFIKICKCLAEINNLHSTFAIISALQSHSIHRLRRTWDCLGRHDRWNFEKIASLFDSDRNWEKLRQHLDRTTLPCIPYLGMFLTDLNFIEARRSEGSNSLTIRPRSMRAERLVYRIRWFQNSSYDHLPRIQCIQNYLSSMQHHEELVKFIEDDIYKQSLLCEPNQPSSSAGLTFGQRINCKFATLSRLRLNRGEESKINLMDVFRTFTPKMQHSYLNQVPLGHRKTRSLDAQTILGLGDAFFSVDDNTTHDHCNESLFGGTKDTLSSSVFYLDKTHENALDVDFCLKKEKKEEDLVDAATGVPVLTYSNTHELHGTFERKGAMHKGVYYPKAVENASQSAIFQGEVRKIVVRTRGSKPAKLKCSRKCYLELSGSVLGQFERRPLALHCCSVRDHYKKKASKIMKIGDDDWKIIGPQFEDDVSFEVHHPATGRIYRYLCNSHTNALIWHSNLVKAGNAEKQSIFTDLITFD